MRYVNARVRNHYELVAYRIYVTDALSGISKYTALGARSEEGVAMSRRYYDIIHQKIETRTANEIIGSIKSKLGGEEVV